MRTGLLIAGILALCPAVGAFADIWKRLDGSQIAAALTGQTVDYLDDNGTWQSFYASGRTLYNAGRDSWGYWAPRGDQYCSQWPPGDLWACYGVAVQGGKIRFIGETGDISEGVFRRD